jgi:hypothetical protein
MGRQRIQWRMAVTLMSLVCRHCYFPEVGHERKVVCFTEMLCRHHGLSPVQRIPQWRNRIRGLVIQHYKAEHPEYEVY